MEKIIYVYFDWDNSPTLLGRLFVDVNRGKEAFSFEYDKNWIQMCEIGDFPNVSFDPDLPLFSGRQYLPSGKKIFGVFSDSCPDRWGRLLMQRREAIIAKQEERKPKSLTESDFLLGVYDETRMGALRFSLDEDGTFLSSDKELAAPPWTTLRTLEDVMRNNLILNDVASTVKNGRTPIILTERREHVALLAELLKPHCDNVIEIVGTASVKSRRETLERLDSIPQEESLVVVATGRYIGEGFDYPRLDTLFLALPIAWKGKVAQYAGRLHRNYSGKTEVQVYDYIDIHVPVLERMYQKRVKSYSAIGYKTKITTASSASPDLIYDGKTFYPVFCRDVEMVQNEVLIVSPFMRKARLSPMLKILTPLILNKVSITVVTRPPENFKDKNKQIVIDCTEQLKQYGINIIYKSDFHQKFAIIDQSVVWYGSVNFLSFGTHEESIMRFENSDVAHQLIDTII